MLPLTDLLECCSHQAVSSLEVSRLPSQHGEQRSTETADGIGRKHRAESTTQDAYQFEVLDATDEIRCVGPPTLDIHTVFKRKRKFKTMAFTFKGTKTGPHKATA